MVNVIPNWTTLLMMVNFLVLWALLHYMLFNPIRGILKKRAENIAELNSDITASQEGARGKKEELAAQQAEARRGGAAEKDAMKAQAQSEERAVIEAATREMESTVSKMRGDIAQEMTAARDALKGQVQEFGAELAEKILGRSIQ